jgi:hypothetical protein
MNLARAVVRAQLHAPHDTNSERLRGKLRFLEPGESIVISERNRGEACCFCCLDYSRRGKRSVGCGRVHVQVDLTGLSGRLPGRHFL